MLEKALDLPWLYILRNVFQANEKADGVEGERGREIKERERERFIIINKSLIFLNNGFFS